MDPIDQHHELQQESNHPLLSDLTSYRRLIGRLIHLTITRPNLASVYVLAQYMTSPQNIHLHAALKLVRYFNHTTHGLFYPTKANRVLTEFCDADRGSCKRTRQSLSGYCITLGTTLVS